MEEVALAGEAHLGEAELVGTFDVCFVTHCSAPATTATPAASVAPRCRCPGTDGTCRLCMYPPGRRPSSSRSRPRPVPTAWPSLADVDDRVRLHAPAHPPHVTRYAIRHRWNALFVTTFHFFRREVARLLHQEPTRDLATSIVHGSARARARFLRLATSASIAPGSNHGAITTSACGPGATTAVGRRGHRAGGSARRSHPTPTARRTRARCGYASARPPAIANITARLACSTMAQVARRCRRSRGRARRRGVGVVEVEIAEGEAAARHAVPPARGARGIR